MISSKHPAFAKLAAKLGRAQKELGEIENYLEEIKKPGHLVSEWARTSTLALAVHSVYNGIEDVMLSLANDVDGYVPTGESAHQDLLDQMSVAIERKRPAVVGPELYGLLVEVKGFRHVVRHRYGLELDPRKVDENVDRIRKAFPAFVQVLIHLERVMTAEQKDEAEPSGPSCSP